MGVCSGARRSTSQATSRLEGSRQAGQRLVAAAPTALVHFFDADDSDDDSWFEFPWENQAWDLVDLQQPRSAARRNAAAAVLPIYRRLVPGEGWLWPAGRDFLLLLGSGEAIPLVSLEQAAISEAVGPLGALTIACLKPSATATRVGQERLTLEAFRRDYQPLLSGDSWLSKWLLSLAEAARSLDEAELRAMIAAVCHDEQARIGAHVVARAIKQSADKPVAELVSTLLDSMWDSGISTAIASPTEKANAADRSGDAHQALNNRLADVAQRRVGEKRGFTGESRPGIARIAISRSAQSERPWRRQKIDRWLISESATGTTGPAIISAHIQFSPCRVPCPQSSGTNRA